MHNETFVRGLVKVAEGNLIMDDILFICHLQLPHPKRVQRTEQNRTVDGDMFLSRMVTSISQGRQILLRLIDEANEKPFFAAVTLIVCEMSREQASAWIDAIWQEIESEQWESRAAEIEERSLIVDGKSIHWYECIYDEDRPSDGHSLWISMHGGGSCPAAVNDQQYENQKSLYTPSEGIWIVPRSPTDAWNQWHQEHIDRMFDRIIENYILVKKINSNRIYLLGYSAGGDGVYQLAPRMADRFAAAAMMAGHPNNASPVSLRNLPFTIFVGENDVSYNRNDKAREWGRIFDELQRSDPEGYEHSVTLCKKMEHWMCGRDADALPWMAQWTRNPWPKKIIWMQGNVLHQRFYWLAIPDRSRAKTGQTIIAQVDHQTIRIEANEDLFELKLFLSDELIDLDEPVKIEIDGIGCVFDGMVPRTVEAIRESLNYRCDRQCIGTAMIDLIWKTTD